MFEETMHRLEMFCENNILTITIFVILICMHFTFDNFINIIIKRLSLIENYFNIYEKQVLSLNNKIKELEKREKYIFDEEKMNNESIQDFILALEKLGEWVFIIEKNLEKTRESVMLLKDKEPSENIILKSELPIPNDVKDFQQRISGNLDEIVSLKKMVQIQISEVQTKIEFLKFNYHKKEVEKTISKKDILIIEVKSYIDFFQDIDIKNGNNVFTGIFVNSFQIPYYVSITNISKKYFQNCYFLPIEVPFSYRKNLFNNVLNDPVNSCYPYENEIQRFTRYSKTVYTQNLLLQRYLNESDEEFDIRLIEILLNHFKFVYSVYKTGLHFGFRLNIKKSIKNVSAEQYLILDQNIANLEQNSKTAFDVTVMR